MDVGRPALPELSELGLPKVVREFPGYSQGLVLITGETGSGKSTTRIGWKSASFTASSSWAMERAWMARRMAGVTLRISNTPVRPRASVLRSVLRQDPDIIAVGEIRDGETAEIAMRACPIRWVPP